MGRDATNNHNRPALESGEAMCAVNPNYRIVAWNGAAEQLFGLPERDVIGRPCYEVVAGKNGQGAPVCGRGCLSMQLATRGLPVGAFDMERAGSSGSPQAFSCISLLSHANGGSRSPVLLHIFRQNDDRLKLRAVLKELAQIVNRQSVEPAAATPGRQLDVPLTARELEVLRLLRQGLGTKDIGSRLFISPLTVCNHIKHAREKLQAHTRLQAVSAADRLALL